MTPTTLQTSIRGSATSTPKSTDRTSVSPLPRADITCFDKIAIVAKDNVKEAFIKHTCDLWDDKQLRSGTPGHDAAVEMTMLREGVKMYLYIGILPFNGDWIYALESSL
jgi:hypothetical protein